MSSDSSYYVPESSKLPIFMAFGLLLFVLGGSTINDLGKESSNSYILLMTSFAVIWGVMFVWFSNVINENNKGCIAISSTNLLFGVWLGLFFLKSCFSLHFSWLLAMSECFLCPWLGGKGKAITNILWPAFEATWPVMVTPDNETFPELKKHEHARDNQTAYLAAFLEYFVFGDFKRNHCLS